MSPRATQTNITTYYLPVNRYKGLKSCKCTTQTVQFSRLVHTGVYNRVLLLFFVTYLKTSNLNLFPYTLSNASRHHLQLVGDHFSLKNGQDKVSFVRPIVKTSLMSGNEKIDTRME